MKRSSIIALLIMCAFTALSAFAHPTEDVHIEPQPFFTPLSIRLPSLENILNWFGFGFIGAKPEKKESIINRENGGTVYDSLNTRLKELAEESPEEAYALLKREMAEHPLKGYFAHYAGHIVGEAAYNKYGLEGSRVCDSSFLHACFHRFMMRAIEVAGIDAALEACDLYATGFPEGPRRSYAYLAACAHGAGHGLFSVEGSTLKPALAACEVFRESPFIIHDEFGNEYLNGPQACKEGVFMEFADTTPPRARDFFKDPWGQCAALKTEEDQRACARYRAFILGNLLHTPQPKDLIGLCESAPTTAMKDACYFEGGSLEILFSDVGALSTDILKKTCRSITRPEGRYHCAAGGAGTFVIKEYENYERAITELCGILPKQDRLYCILHAELAKKYVGL